jgi:hypothetical protein
MLNYPQWQEPLAAAFLEFDAQQPRDKVRRAEKAITYRIEELAVDKGNEEEPRALSDGLSIIRNLKKERLGFREGNS